MMKTQVTSIPFAALMPHPPIIVPGVGRGREKDAEKTLAAMRLASERALASGGDTLVLISPHSPRRRGAFGIWRTERLRGDLSSFGDPEDATDLPNDSAFADRLCEEGHQRGLRFWDIRTGELDHGALVPLYYLAGAGWSGPTTILSLNFPGEGGLEELGQAIEAAAEALERRMILIASGDMSHRLSPGAPGGFHPRAQNFDAAFVEVVRSGHFRNVAKIESQLQDIAGEDVVDSSVVAVAALDYDSSGHQVLSYEGPFGVGYCVAVLHEGEKGGGEREPEQEQEQDKARGGEVLPAVAREAVAAKLRGRTEHLTALRTGYLAQRAGVFVTIHTRDGELRGCIGSIAGQHENLVDETRDRAVSAAFHDLRFPPIKAEELDNLTFEVSVLHQPEPAKGPEELDPAVYGVILHTVDGRRAVMLPGIETLDTVAKQLAATRRKAGIRNTESVTIERFRVDKFTDGGARPPNVRIAE